MRKITFAKKALMSLVIIVNLLVVTQLSSQCTFNCIDTVNVSVNNMCIATVTPALVLKGYNPSSTCNYGIELFDTNGNIINLDFTRADIGPQFVGSTLKIRIFEAGVSNPNSCWGYINVEDKLPPDIVCVGNDTIECFNDIFADESQAEAHLKGIIESTLIDNCGNEEVTVNITRNDLIRQLCQDTFAAMRIVGYNVLDNNFNVTTCEDTIFYARFPLDSIDAPKNYVDNMVIDCSEPYPSVAYLIGKDSESPGNNSTPNINGISIADYADSLFTERGLCNFKMTTSDLIFETCGNTFKIVRIWNVIDWCNSNNPRIFNQVIKVVDHDISASNISNIGPIGAEYGSNCDVSVELPFPNVSANECNSWSYSITIKEPDGTLFFPFGAVRDSMLQVVPRRFVLGTSVVRYTIVDICGNTTIKEFEVTVEDQEPPIPVCDYTTVVTLNDNFLGKARARSFDDGSYDFCSDIVSYKVRRQDRFETDCPTPLDYDDFVKFCCSDLGKIITVELQVTDGAGLTSTCWAKARVQYKGPGPNVSCPSDLPVQSCTTYDDFDISTLTPPTITSSNPCIGDLAPQIREAGRNMDICGDGYIDVEWFYNLTGEEDIICTNRITFANPTPFTVNDINWPVDRVVNTCDDAPPTQAELDAMVPDDLACSNVVISEPLDRIIENVPNTCVRILRTWTVVDWCRFPADLSAKWTFVQTIDIVNSDPPVIDISGSNLSLDPKPDSCRAHMVITGSAVDDCTPADDLVWTHRLDLVRGGQEIPLIFERPGRILERRIDAGVYILTWTAMDHCGNTSLARQNFIIEDDLSPIALCGFAIRDIDASNSVTVTALELDAGSYDNCRDELTYTIKRAGDNSAPMSELVFTCDDVGVNDVELIVTDYMGNQSVCNASVDIRDGQGTCGFGASTLTLGGNIMTPESIAVESARVMLSMNTTNVQSKMTEVDGEYSFDNLEGNQNYALSAEKNDDYINGVSTLDIILIQRHILGLSILDTPYKIIAADINNSETISAVDIVLLRRLILGHISEFPTNNSWSFIDPQYQFEDETWPWPFDQSVNLGPLDESTTQELLAIKIGDVNSSAIANSGFASSRSADTYKISKSVTKDADLVTLKVKTTKAITAMGYQLGFSYDEEALRVTDIKSRHAAIVDGMIYDKNGQLRLSVATARDKEYRENEVFVEISFTLNGTAKYNDNMISLYNQEDFKSEIYTSNFEGLQLEVANSLSEEQILLYQNRPNPFYDQTFIDFEIPKSEEVTFELFDINGSKVYRLKEHFEAGRRQIHIHRENLGLTKGIYYYQIHTNQRSLIKKMIIL